MTDKSTLKKIIEATLERLNRGGPIASASDVTLALRRAQEKKVQEALASVFNTLTIEELGAAAEVADEMFPRPTVTMTPLPIATPAPSLTAPKKRKK